MLKETQLRIGIDGFNLGLEKGTGVATYARTLSRALTGMGHPVDVLYGLDIPKSNSPAIMEINFFDTLCSAPQPRKRSIFTKKWWQDRSQIIIAPKVIKIPITGRIDARSFSERLPIFDRLFNARNLFRKAEEHFRLTGKLMPIHMNNPPQIMHWTYPIPVQLKGALNVYTLHDIVPLRLPHTTLDNKTYYFRLLKKIGEQSSALCTVSEASKKDILSFFPEFDGKLYNTYQTSDNKDAISNYSDEECVTEIRSKFNLTPKEYFIFFGSLEPKKNIGRIIEAFLASNCRRQLVLVGAMAWKTENELRYLDHGIATGRIMLINYLPERTLFALLRQARALLFPSLSEGFGLPVLEAMNCGVPTLISEEGALPEVGGNASLRTNAYDIKAIADSIRKLDQDDALCEALSIAGYHQATRFSMESYQELLSKMYHSMLSLAQN
ncbi:glycosyltransferase family 1 protein [Saccharibacter sp. 17.LH.SD]|uniref:glycosyltransferase family 4 protein n=1 Tax=Saccharibacter sp. 17.LH.SD TaxID=2689393 RepID=UPI0019295ED3|nr:glycosyltransferase family 1 protein [Saccharibacter sp. 17.LH.SD]